MEQGVPAHAPYVTKRGIPGVDSRERKNAERIVLRLPARVERISPDRGEMTSPISSPTPTNRNGDWSEETKRSLKSPRSLSPPKSKKRLRPLPCEGEEQGSAFHLRHQNRALVSELLECKRKISVLGKEKDDFEMMEKFEREKMNRVEEVWKGCMGSLVWFLDFCVERKNLDSNSKVQLECFKKLSQALQNQKYDVSVKTESSKMEETEKFDEIITSQVQEMAQPLQTEAKGERICLKKWSSSLHDAKSLHTTISQCGKEIKRGNDRCVILEIDRDKANQNEKEMRRILYRLVSGRLSLEYVKKEIEFDPTKFLIAPEGPTTDVVPSSSSSSCMDISPSLPLSNNFHVTNNQEEQFKKCITDLEAALDFRNNRIEELLEEQTNQTNRITSLLQSNTSLPKLTEEIKTTQTYTQLAVEKYNSERKARDLQTQLEKAKSQWATAKADALLTFKAFEQIQEKYLETWNISGILNILCALDNPSSLSDDQSPPTTSPEEQSLLDAARKARQLDCKYQQALQEASQTKNLRTMLATAKKMNGSLQAKVSELNIKYAAVTASKNSLRKEQQQQQEQQRCSLSSSSTHSTSPTSSSGPLKSSKSSSNDRLKSDFRKARKELAAATLSKDNYKSKLDKCLKECASISKTNSRLLKLNAKQEEMNTKSLCEIVNLKQQIQFKEKKADLLQIRIESADELAQAAKFISKAKKRLDGGDKLKTTTALELDLENQRQSNDVLCAQADVKDAEIAMQVRTCQISQSRCQELSEIVQCLEKQKTQCMEDLAVAKQNSENSAIVANEGTSTSLSNDAALEDFSVQQLRTHVSVLKCRLACPVCNDRDKACILLRCRHMFCRTCIDENVRNRSRKCPACGQRYDTKDVANVWL